MLLRNWVWVFFLVFFLGTVTHTVWPVAFSVAAAIVLGIVTFWRRHALDHVTYHRHWVYRRGFPGEQIPLRIVVANRKLLPLSWLRTIDIWPMPVAPDDEKILAPSHIEETGELINLYSLRWFQQIERVYRLTLRRRGLYTVGPVEMNSGDFFGMYEESAKIENQERLTIFPELLPLNSLRLPSQDPLGDRSAIRRLFEDPIQSISIRPYHPEDSIRRIHWPATARTGELQVRVFQPVSARVMVVCLNASTQAQYWLGVDSDRLEYLIKIAATLVYRGVLEGCAVGLLSNGCLAHSDQPFQIPPGSSTDHLAHLLSALASVTSYTIAPFETYLLQAMPRVPYGASIMIVTTQVTTNLALSLLRLSRYRANTTLVTLSGELPVPISGVHVVQMPYPPE